jgi:hypothetical protein
MRVGEVWEPYMDGGAGDELRSIEVLVSLLPTPGGCNS